MTKILFIFLLIINNNFIIERNHIEGAPLCYFTIYDETGECVADDIQLSNIYEILIEGLGRN